MASITETSRAQGFLQGILHPKLPHQFAVYFRAVSVTDDGDSEELKGLLNVLSMQLIEVQLPKLALGGYAKKSTPEAFTARRHSDDTVFVFQDDLAGQVSQAIDTLSSGAWIGATVCRLDGREKVIEAFDLRGVKFLSVQHSLLSYYPRGASAQGTITDPRPDENGYPMQTANVSLNFTGGKDVCSSQTVAASAEVILVARFPSGKSINEFLGEL